MFTPCLDIVLLTVVLALLSVGASRLLNGSFTSACGIFWLAWCGFILAVWYCEWQLLIPSVTEQAALQIERGEIGAAAGFLIGSFLAGNPGKKYASLDQQLKVPDQDKLVKWGICLNAIAGFFYLLETIRSVGWNLVTLLFDIRMHYLDQGLTPLGKISEYLSAGTIVMAVMLARRDALYGVRILPITLLILSNMPNGIATGGRGYLVSPIIYYACAYSLTGRWTAKQNLQNTVSDEKRKLPLGKISFALLAILGVFTVIGEWRWGAASDRPIYLRTVDAVLGYPASSITSVYEYSSIYEESAAHGRLLFGWPATQLERIGLLPGNSRDDQDSVREAVYSIYGFAGNCPPTIIAPLVGDFGMASMPYCFAILMTVVQLLTIRLPISGMVGHTLSTVLLAASFFSIQDLMYMNSASCLGIIWAIGITAFMSVKRHSRKTSI